MKKLILGLMTIMLLMTISPSVGYANNNSAPISTTSTTTPVIVTNMLTRLDEINAMDKSSLSATEKKALKSEVKEIKATLRQNGGGVYLSVGAVIIIILLLILLF